MKGWVIFFFFLEFPLLPFSSPSIFQFPFPPLFPFPSSVFTALFPLSLWPPSHYLFWKKFLYVKEATFSCVTMVFWYPSMYLWPLSLHAEVHLEFTNCEVKFCVELDPRRCSRPSNTYFIVSFFLFLHEVLSLSSKQYYNFSECSELIVVSSHIRK